MLEPYVLVSTCRVVRRDIRVGEQWHGRIQSAIERTRVAVLLVNHRFFASTYILQHELPRLVDRCPSGAARLVIVVVGAVDSALMEEHGLSSFQGCQLRIGR
jgi:hypothetical protein